MADKQHLMGFYACERDAATAGAVADYWKSYADELNRQYAATVVGGYLANDLCRILGANRIEPVISRIGQMLNAVHVQQFERACPTIHR